MATSIKKIEMYLMDRGSNSNVELLLYGHKHNKYLRFYIPTIHTSPIWYHLSDDGYVGEQLYNSKDLEAEFKEANGFLEQLELF